MTLTCHASTYSHVLKCSVFIVYVQLVSDCAQNCELLLINVLPVLEYTLKNGSSVSLNVLAYIINRIFSQLRQCKSIIPLFQSIQSPK